MKVTLTTRLLALAGYAMASFSGLTPAAQAQVPLEVYVSAGFDGNTWMDASLNLLNALTKTPGAEGQCAA